MQTQVAEILNFEGGGTYQIVSKSIKCPYCQSYIIPRYIGFVFAFDQTTWNVWMKCTNPNCERIFTAHYNPGLEEYNTYQELAVAEKKFDDCIKTISPSFVNIYNQAYKAEQVRLGEICGIGYRKALEFLIKDYLTSLHPDKKEEFRKEALGICINKIDNSSIKELARRATWLGNDETHYIRKWENRDIQDLKNLIDLTCQYITMESKSKAYLEEMPEKK
jgi:hypothetical protein